LHVSSGFMAITFYAALIALSMTYVTGWFGLLLAIAVPMYVGLTLSSLYASTRPLWPIALLASLVGAAEFLKISRYSLLTLSLIYVAIAMIFSFAGILQIELMCFIGCVVVSAYLAVFESWAVIQDLARQAASIEFNQETLVGRYYNASLLALIISGLSMPLVYIFSGVSALLLSLFGLHAFIAFLLWFVATRNNRIISWSWTWIKIFMGSFVLFSLVVDFRLSKETTPAFVPLPGGTVVYVFLALLSAPIITRVSSVIEEYRTQGIVALVATRDRFIGIISFLSIVGVVISTWIKETPHINEAISARSTHSCVLYAGFWVFSIIYLLVNFRRNKPPGGVFITMAAILFLLRLATSMLICIAFVVIAIRMGTNLLQALMLSLPFTLAAMGGFALNDYCDAEKDRVNRPYRPIPSGKISRTSALFIGFVLIASARIVSAIMSDNIRELSIFAFAITGVCSYNIVVKRFTILKNLWTGVICALPFVYFVVHANMGLVLPLAVFLYVFGREILMDVVDLKGDVSVGIRTLAARMGASASVFGFCMITAGLSVFIAEGQQKFIIWSIVTLFLVSLLAWMFRNGTFRRSAVYILWIPMLIGVIGFCL
jgi:geranylgeranylglycerol-phosphate geranylgeranyltransferase